MRDFDAIVLEIDKDARICEPLDTPDSFGTAKRIGQDGQCPRTERELAHRQRADANARHSDAAGHAAQHQVGRLVERDAKCTGDRRGYAGARRGRVQRQPERTLTVDHDRSPDAADPVPARGRHIARLRRHDRNLGPRFRLRQGRLLQRCGGECLGRRSIVAKDRQRHTQQRSDTERKRELAAAGAGKACHLDSMVEPAR